MKHSIKQQIAIIFMAVMAGTVALCWIVNIFVRLLEVVL